MPTFTSYPAGTPCWIDLMSPDVDASVAFYTGVFGWTSEDQFDDDGNRVYTIFRKDGQQVAGVGGQAPGMDGAPPIWNSYVASDDPAADIGKAEAAGGTVMMPPMPVMDAGEMAIFTDPTGAAISVWKANNHFGAEVANEPDTWSWNELMTRDVEAAAAFYTEVFGWEYDEMDMGPMGIYRVIRGGESGGLGGLQAMPSEMPDMVPNHWGVIFTVADVAASVEKVTGNGGQVVQPPMTIPGVGTMATVHDPAGGNFSVLQPEATAAD